MKKSFDRTTSVNIIEVYEDNFVEEIKRIGTYLDDYNYIGMDTEFPGTVYGLDSFTKDFYYKELKLNVDSLKLIQLGITLCNEKGEYPPDVSTWQFNLKFDYKKDHYETSSFNMLCECGIDFHKLKRKGIDHKTFAEYLTISGLVLNPEVHWISFHGSYDFAYMFRLLINDALPEDQNEFTKNLVEYFPNHYDIRILTQGKDNLKGGLNKIAQTLDIYRIGQVHQAGSDSVVTADVFFKLLQNNQINNELLKESKNILFGIGEGADDNETILYTKFNNQNINSQLSSSGNNYFNNSKEGSNLSANNLPLNFVCQPFLSPNYNFPFGIKMENQTQNPSFSQFRGNESNYLQNGNFKNNHKGSNMQN
ncbi:MAG: hypothetical protein MJ252_29480 [archaeon]|nr:hypothetical protein [archaeon]